MVLMLNSMFQSGVYLKKCLRVILNKGRNGGYTPFDLLELSIEDKPIHGKLPSKLFQEFAIAMKGQRQLVWGRGLKKIIKN